MMQLLLIEDDLADQMIFERIVKKCDYDCHLDIAGTVKEGLHFMANNEYDTVFCDFNLPDGTAIELLSHASVSESDHVIVLTSQGDIEKATESIKSGAFDFITKDNVTIPGLERTLKNLLRLQKENYVREELERKLEANFSNTTAILDNSTDGVWSLDLSGNLLIINKIAKEDLAYHVDAHPEIGEPFFDTLPDVFATKFKSLFDKAVANEATVSVEEINLNGRVFFLEVASNPILLNKKVTGVIFFARNVTSRVEAEEKIKESKLIAEKALDFKSRFLANMSHEIRTPMNAMLGFTDLLNKTALIQEQQEYVDIIRNSGEDLLIIINDILDLAKIQSGNIELRNTNFNLAETLNDTVRLHQFKAEEKGDKLAFQMDSTVPKWLYGDDARLTQILNNLISNAIKFTNNGFVTINVTAVEKSKSESTIQFSVKDTGLGIPSDMLEKIFDDFTQVESSLQREAKGTGLGLAIVSSLVQLMGGKLSVDSTVEKGSEFTATIDFAHGEMEVKSAQKPEELKSFLKGVKILICDDVALNRLLVSKILEPYQAEMYFAENGKEAVEMVKAHKPNIIFMDIQMPVMDGYQATKLIQEFTITPVIAMTAHALEEERERCKEAGMDGFISKPFKEAELIDVLKNELDVDLDMKVEAVKTDFWEELNMPQLAEVADGNKDFVKSIFDLFLELADTKLTESKTAIIQNDLQVLKGIAHMLKPSLTLFNFEELRTLADKIEDQAASPAELETFHLLLEKAREEVTKKSEMF